MTSRVIWLIASAWLLVGAATGPASAEDPTPSGSYSRRTIIHSESNTSGASGGSSTSSSGGSSGTSSQSGSTTSSTTTETVEQSGVMGFKHSNKFVPKYKERIETYKHQIQLGLSKGWLSSEDGDKFSKELARLTELEAAVASKHYAKPEVDDLDKQFTKFNMEFTNAGQKKTAAPAATPAANTAAAATASSTKAAAGATKSGAATKPAASATKAPPQPASKPSSKAAKK